MVYFVFFSICCFAKECPIVWKQYWQEQCWSESWSETFSCSCIWIFLNCNLVFYETKGCAWGSLNANFWYVCGSICFYLGTQIMFEDFWSNFSWVLLLFEGFEMCVLWLLWVFYGKEDQTLLIDDERSKTFQNPNWSGFFLESFRGELLWKNKVQLLDLAFRLWPTLIKLPLMNTIPNHYDVLVKYLMPCLSFFLQNYS